jgi:hypothetical protein
VQDFLLFGKLCVNFFLIPCKNKTNAYGPKLAMVLFALFKVECLMKDPLCLGLHSRRPALFVSTQ